MSDHTKRPTSEVLRVAFVPSAWRRSLRGFPFIVGLAALAYIWRWVRADAYAVGYSDFFNLDAPELPFDYWFGLDTWLLLVGLVHLLVLRLRRNPEFVIGEDRIETAFTQSYTRRIDRDRVTEVRFDEGQRTIRFEIPDGLVLRVDAGLLDLSPLGDDIGTFAERCARTLDVPFVRV